MTKNTQNNFFSFTPILGLYISPVTYGALKLANFSDAKT